MCANGEWVCDCNANNKVKLDTKVCRELWALVMDDDEYRVMNGMNAKKAAATLAW
jgi:hypothetical protein